MIPILTRDTTGTLVLVDPDPGYGDPRELEGLPRERETYIEARGREIDLSLRFAGVV